MIAAYMAFKRANLLRIPEEHERQHFVDAVADVMKELESEFKPLTVQNGQQLVSRDSRRLQKMEGHFLHPLMNPSERRTAVQTWELLNADVLSGAWGSVTAVLSKQLDDWKKEPLLASIDQLRESLRAVDRGVLARKLFRGERREYATIRMLRAYLYIWRLPTQDSEDDYVTLSTMSKDMKDHFIADGITSYDDAILARNILRNELGRPAYDFMDLACFICLRH